MCVCIGQKDRVRERESDSGWQRRATSGAAKRCYKQSVWCLPTRCRCVVVAGQPLGAGPHALRARACVGWHPQPSHILTALFSTACWLPLSTSLFGRTAVATTLQPPTPRPRQARWVGSSRELCWWSAHSCMVAPAVGDSRRGVTAALPAAALCCALVERQGCVWCVARLVGLRGVWWRGSSWWCC